jgi:hydroxymethylbilane synthase
MAKVVRVGTRRSPLARAQAELVVDMLKARYKDLQFEVIPFTTAGDEKAGGHGGRVGIGKDAFTKNIEEQLLEGRVDLAVHSLKDLPEATNPLLDVAAIPKREDPRDALVAAEGVKLSVLPPNSKIGTSSARRRAQLLAFRPDLQMVEIHGNVGTRIRRMKEEGLDALVLSAAGLLRLGLRELISQYIPVDIMLPSPGQGALAVQVRKGDSITKGIVRVLDDAKSRAAVEAERAFAFTLGGGCNLPVGALATVDAGRLLLEGMVATPDGRRVLRASIASLPSQAAEAGFALAERLRSMGASDIVGESG